MRWTSQYPHRHTLGVKDTEFADGSVMAAGNYCRDPDNSGFLWCYTTNPAVKWERCDVETCGKCFYYYMGQLVKSELK